MARRKPGVPAAFAALAWVVVLAVLILQDAAFATPNTKALNNTTESCPLPSPGAHEVRAPRLGCGYNVPGRSPLWKEQTSNCYSRKRTVFCDMGMNTELGMLILSDAVEALDEGKTWVPEVAAADWRWRHDVMEEEARGDGHRGRDDGDPADLNDQASLQKHCRGLRSRMIPHVVRGVLDKSVAAEAIDAMGSLEGTTKSTNPDADGFVAKYYGGAEELKTLHDFLEERVASESYWVSCNPAEAATRHTDDRASKPKNINRNMSLWPPPFAGLVGAGKDWFAATTERLAPLIMAGLVGSRLDYGCFRASLAPSRIAMHSDNTHSFLVQLSGGPRKVLLLMPDMAPHLQLFKLKVGNRTGLEAGGGRGRSRSNHSSAKSEFVFQSTIDPRHLAERSSSEDPNDLRNTPLAVPVTLEDGDALHIPASWWHYIEAPGGSVPTLAMSFTTTSIAKPGEFIEHPCEEGVGKQEGLS